MADIKKLLGGLGLGMLGFASGYKDPVETFKMMGNRGQSTDDIFKLWLMQQMGGGQGIEPATMTGAAETIGAPKPIGMPEQNPLLGGGLPTGAPPTEYDMGLTMGLKQDPISSMQQDLWKEGQKAGIQSQKEVESQRAKAGEQTSRDYFRVGAAIDTTFDAALSFSDEQYKKFGLKPGDFLGVADKITPRQWNQFKEAYEGSAREASALVARNLIPGVRGANITQIFQKSVAQPGSTMEGSANNIAFTMQNNFAAAVANDMLVVDEATGNKVSIQDVIIDEKTGKKISELAANEKKDAINRVKRRFGDDLRYFYLGQAYVRNPKLLQKKTIDDLKSKAQKFGSVEEMEKAGLAPGTVVLIGGRLGVSE